MFPFDLLSLAHSFSKRFQIVPAMTVELRDAAYRIRHSVYCEELGFEPVRPDGREIDEYDAQSVHCLIRSREADEFIGCTRLILCRRSDPHHPLPFERTCAASLDRSILDPQSMPRNRIAEVSRLAVIGRYRRRRGERGTPAPISEASFDQRLRPRFPFILVGLYLATTELASRYGIDTLFVLSEPKLAHHFARLGVTITALGPVVNHRGLRVPSALDVQGILGGLNFLMRPLHAVIEADIDEGMHAQLAAA
jgi:N-acyl amino acid synthase of PEP-CTERM/exosortase system